jgi:hypothetical protein
MKKLFVKTGVLAVVVVVTTAALFLLPIPYSHDLSAIHNKLNMLKAEKRNRIIFVGGSGLYDGLDSEKIQQTLGRPVINLGLYAGFGVTALLREVRPFLRPGDTVVVVPEYSVVFDFHDDQARKWLFAYAPVKNLLLLYRDVPNRALTLLVDCTGLMRSKLQALPRALQEAVRSRSCRAFFRAGYVYYGKYFNESGDSLRTMRTPESPEMIEQRGVDLFAEARYRDQSLDAINDFCRESRSRGSETYFIYPAYPAAEYRRQADGMRRYQQRLRKELACPILGNAEQFLYPYSYFTNTVNHINNEARRIRTDQVIALLKTIPTPSQRAGAAPKD